MAGVYHRVTLDHVPTKHRRHAITETPPVKHALDALRTELNSDRVDLTELVLLGAESKLERLRLGSEESLRLRRDLADRIRRREDLGVDLQAADEVKRVGWAGGL